MEGEIVYLGGTLHCKDDSETVAIRLITRYGTMDYEITEVNFMEFLTKICGTSFKITEKIEWTFEEKK